MELHYSTVYEQIADALPDAPALVHGASVRSWADFDDRAARLAAALLAAGLGRDSKVAIYLYNSSEWLEALHAALKVRAVPVNVNYRYLDDELAYLLANSDAEAVVYDVGFAERVDRVRPRVPGVRAYLQVGGGDVPDWALDYERAIAGHEPAPRLRRSEDDVMFTYTGGTTGLPKGVIIPMGRMARGSVNFGAGGFAIPDWPAEVTPAFARALRERGDSPVTCPAVPLMHSSGLTMGALPTLLVGGSVVTLTSRSLNPAELCEAIGRRRITTIVIAGDAVARPLLHHLEAARRDGREYDFSSVRVMMSAGVAWSADVKLGLFDYLPHVTLQDGCGSTEGGIGYRRIRKGDSATTNSFAPVPGVKLLRDDGSEVAPGSGERGRFAVPSTSVGYYKDKEKTEAVFTAIDGVRYVLAGDYGLREADGSVILLGRGTTVINTGGEKVFPEEVEEAVKTFPGVRDCLVTGTPHERFGSQVTAVVSLFDGARATEAQVAAHVRGRLAGYKAPRVVVFVDVVPRHPNGKPDLAGAQRLADRTEPRTRSE